MEVNSIFQSYCNSLTQYSRFNTREVNIGDTPLGGQNPIRLQSMTTHDTMDTNAVVEQAIRMIRAGAEYVRITTPSINEANNLAEIKKKLISENCYVPLIADIHYTPNAAETAARIVEKIRINPGNYSDRSKTKKGEYSDEEYITELEKIREKLAPLITICKEYGTTMRIGVNHGSLSDRILSRYGDTPSGMVESALEFVRVCEEVGYNDIVLSMKASNPVVMIQSNRLLINKMVEEGMNYPIHLGVTEAGEGADGRIRSAIGIGALLEDGIGDTIRVSLTEPPEDELPVAKMLVERVKDRLSHEPIIPIEKMPLDPFVYNKKQSIQVNTIGGQQVPIVIMDISKFTLTSPADLRMIGYDHNPGRDRFRKLDMAADFIFMGNKEVTFPLPQDVFRIYDYVHWKSLQKNTDSFPLLSTGQYLSTNKRSAVLNFIHLSVDDLTTDLLASHRIDKTAVLIISTNNTHGMAEQRSLFYNLITAKISNPVIIKRSYSGLPDSTTLLHASTDLGTLLIDGLGDGIWIDCESSPAFTLETCFGILQATRTRISKAEYVSCPSCGRTLFDLEQTTRKIKDRTAHLKDVKIAIMGCIVNGPGEMADADYGYVGSGPGKITLYRNKEIIKKNLTSTDGLDELVKLIKEDNRWQEK